MTERRSRYTAARTPDQGRRLLAGTDRALAAIYAQVSEDELLRWVVDLARTYGLLCYHTHWSLRSQAGYPDCCLVPDPQRWPAERVRDLVRHGVPLLRLWELKRECGVLTSAQRLWRDALLTVADAALPGIVEYRVVRPSDKAEIEAALARMLEAAERS